MERPYEFQLLVTQGRDFPLATKTEEHSLPMVPMVFLANEKQLLPLSPPYKSRPRSMT